MRRLILILLIAGTASADVATSVDEYFTRLAAHGYSGAVLVARGEEIVLRKGYGFADKQRRIANRPDTAFTIASLDKQFIAAGILRLEELGKLKTTDTLARFYDFAPADKKDITLHQVLTHTAGFPDEYWDSYETLTRAEFIRKILLEKPLDSPPGMAWSYASFDYWLLEDVIEKMTGAPFEHFLRKELFQPAGMQLTGFELPQWTRDNVARYSFWAVPKAALQGESRFIDPLERPAAWRMLLSTADDLHRWYLALRAGRVLTAESRAKLFAPVMNRYAYGWNVVPTARGTKLIHHGGGGDFGSSVTFRWFVDEDTLVTVFNNSFMGGFNADFVMADVEQLLFGGGAGTLPPPAGNDDQTAVAGTYRMPRGGTIDVIRIPDGGPVVALSRDPEAIAALRLGGTDGGQLPQDAIAKEILAAASLGDLAPLERYFGGDSARRGELKELREWAKAVFPRWAKANGQLLDIRTMHARTFMYDGQPESHSFVRLRYERGDEYLRVLHMTGGAALDRLRPPPGIEAVLAPSPGGGYTLWEPRLASAVRIHFSAKGETREMRMTGSAGSVVAVRGGEGN